MIPRRLHQIWLGGDPPPQVQNWTASWRELHPEWEYFLWTDENRPRLTNEAAFKAASSFAMRADLLRYELLLEHGGVYADADFECHRPIDPLIAERDLLLVSEFGIVCNGILGCSPGSDFMRALAAEAALAFGNASAARRSRPHLVTGPHLVDRLFVEMRLYDNDPEVLLPGDYFFEPRTRFPDVLLLAESKRFASHHALASWRIESGISALARRSKLRTRLGRFIDLKAP